MAELLQIVAVGYRHGGRTGDRGGDRVGGGDRLAACGLQGHAVGEGVHAVVGGGEGVVAGQYRLLSLLVKWTVPV